MAQLKQLDFPHFEVKSRRPRTERFQIRTSEHELTLIKKIRAKLKSKYVRDLSDSDIFTLALESLGKEQGLKV